MCLGVNQINALLSHQKQNTNHFIPMPKLMQSNLPLSQTFQFIWTWGFLFSICLMALGEGKLTLLWGLTWSSVVRKSRNYHYFPVNIRISISLPCLWSCNKQNRIMLGYVAWITTIFWCVFLFFFLNSDDLVQLPPVFSQHLQKTSASIR